MRTLCRRALCATVAALLAGVLAVPAATADDIDDRRAAAQKRQSQILAQRDKLAGELEDTDSQLAQAALDLKAIEAKLPVAQAELLTAQAEVSKTQRTAALLAQRLSDAQSQEKEISQQIATSSDKTADAKANIAEMARQAYRGQGDVSAVGIVTGAQSTRQFIDDYAISSTAARSQSRTLQQLQHEESIARNREARLTAVRKTVASLKSEADKNVKAAQAAKEKAAKQKATVESLVAQQKQKNATISARKATALAQIKKNDAAEQSLTSELKAIVAQQRERDRKLAEQQKKSAPKGGGSSGGSSGGGTGGGSSSGKGSGGASGSGGSGGGSQKGAPGAGILYWPTAVPYVTSSYGYRFHPVLHIWRLHAGTDFRAHCGTPVLAARNGTVLYARTLGNGAKQVVIDHGWVNGYSLMTGYLHLTRWVVYPGQKVTHGQVIGYSGNTGVSTACHLHFEVYKNGGTINPMSIL